MAALKIADNSTGNVTITLKGENSLTGGKRCAGLQKNGDVAGIGELVITGDGKLTATGGDAGGGIGSGRGGTAHDIEITGGDITAIGGGAGAGIGGGRSCPEENDPKGTASGITISGGDMTATGGKNAPGIGGGGSGERTSFDHDPDSGQIIETITPTSGAAGTNIEISGGNVTVTGGENAAAIGSGKDGPAAGGNTISGGVVHAAGASGKTAIEGSNIHSTTSKTTVIGDQGSVTVSGNEAVDASTRC